jgi:hypothetical protein
MKATAGMTTLHKSQPDTTDKRRTMEMITLTYANKSVPDPNPNVLGLDQETLAVVAPHKFKPATLQGKPIRVALNIEVNFRIY